jgi:DNA-binding LacI/PurR family transcriptional regulator
MWTEPRVFEDAVAYLAGLGHRTYWFYQTADGLMCSKIRLEGFMNAMEKISIA